MISRSVGVTCLDLCMNEKKAQLVVTMYNNYFTYKFLYFFIFIHSSTFAPLRWFLPRIIGNIWIGKALIKWRLFQVMPNPFADAIRGECIENVPGQE